MEEEGFKEELVIFTENPYEGLQAVMSLKVGYGRPNLKIRSKVLMGGSIKPEKTLSGSGGSD
jgi:hypothetical protein